MISDENKKIAFILINSEFWRNITFFFLFLRTDSVPDPSVLTENKKRIKKKNPRVKKTHQIIEKKIDENQNLEAIIREVIMGINKFKVKGRKKPSECFYLFVCLFICLFVCYFSMRKQTDRLVDK